MPTVTENRATIIDVLRQADMEDWHIMDEYFAPDNTLDTKPALGNCFVCAMGLCALAIGFDDFTLVREGDEDPVTGGIADRTFWTYEDTDVINFLVREAGVWVAIGDRVVTLNDEEHWTLANIADYLEAEWAPPNEYTDEED